MKDWKDVRPYGGRKAASRAKPARTRRKAAEITGTERQMNVSMPAPTRRLAVSGAEASGVSMREYVCNLIHAAATPDQTGVLVQARLSHADYGKLADKARRTSIDIEDAAGRILRHYLTHPENV